MAECVTMARPVRAGPATAVAAVKTAWSSRRGAVAEYCDRAVGVVDDAVGDATHQGALERPEAACAAHVVAGDAEELVAKVQAARKDVVGWIYADPDGSMRRL